VPTKSDIYILFQGIIIKSLYLVTKRGHRGRDRIVVGFTTTCAISVYHH